MSCACQSRVSSASSSAACSMNPCLPRRIGARRSLACLTDWYSAQPPGPRAIVSNSFHVCLGRSSSAGAGTGCLVGDLGLPSSLDTTGDCSIQSCRSRMPISVGSGTWQPCRAWSLNMSSPIRRYSANRTIDHGVTCVHSWASGGCLVSGAWTPCHTGGPGKAAGLLFQSTKRSIASATPFC